MGLNHNPPLILKLLLLSISVCANPGLSFEKRYKHARNIIVLHHLVDDRDWQSFKVVRDEPDQAETCHCGLKFDVCDLLIQVMLLCLTDNLFGGLLLVGLNEFTIGKSFALLCHGRELPVAVVDQLDQCIIGGLTCRPVVKEDF